MYIGARYYAPRPLSQKRDKDAAMRITALLFAMLVLVGCSKPAPDQQSHMTDITDGMPRLALHMSVGGHPVTAEDFRGKVVALYFGYSHCPDVCPTTLANLADMGSRVHSPDLAILFVTVDPDRDTDAVLADYAKAFSPQVVGLRGDANELADLARRYRVAYTVTKGPPYEVIHSNAVFFFDRDGRARLVTTDTTDTASMADDVKRLLN
jgi:protein SCO1/2